MGRSGVLIGLLLLMSAQLPAAEVGVETLEKLPAVQRAAEFFVREADWILQQQIRLTSIPAPPFHEEERGRYLEEQFRALGLENVRRDAIGNVLGERPGSDPEHVVLISAHIDTVFPAGTEIAVRHEGENWVGPGIADNGAGVAALLALAGALRDTRLRTGATLLFAANVGEEGEGNLRGMQALFADGALRRRVRAAIAIDGSNAERLTAQALGSKRFQIVVRGPGGHSWADFGLPNPIQALARAITRMTAVQVPAQPRTAFNVGEISGGTAVNAIPYEASVKVDIRSEMESEIERLEYEMRAAVAEAVAQANRWKPRFASSAGARRASCRPRPASLRSSAPWTPTWASRPACNGLRPTPTSPSRSASRRWRWAAAGAAAPLIPRGSGTTQRGGKLA